MFFLFFAFLIYFLAVAFFMYICFSFFYFKGWHHPPYIPSFGQTKKKVIQQVSEILNASDTPLNIADLGCGDGSLLSGLSPQFPQHHFYGYEWDPLPYHIARRRLKKYKNTRIIQANLMTQDLHHLDVVLCYLGHIPGLNDRLKNVLKPSAIVICEVFEMDGWKPYKIESSR